jgi:hypothetical protein
MHKLDEKMQQQGRKNLEARLEQGEREKSE